MIPQFASKGELFNWLRQNKHLLLQAKKSAVKHSDAIAGINIVPSLEQASEIAKELGVAAAPLDGSIMAKIVINTTNLLDSHGDVHIDGLWKKSLQEMKLIYHIQEHKMQFDKVISDDVKAFTNKISWKSLGYDYEGNTEALIFDSTIKALRNQYMYDQYIQGHVKNHSVGMRYVRLSFCVNSEEKWWIEEKEAWDKYYPMIANKEAADENGYFWAVTEAKVVEGSAVLIGSNSATPTISISDAGKATSDNIEPDESTQKTGSRFASIGTKRKNKK